MGFLRGAFHIRQQILAQPCIALVDCDRIVAVFPWLPGRRAMIAHQGTEGRPFRPANIDLRIRPAGIASGIRSPVRQAASRGIQPAAQRRSHAEEIRLVVAGEITDGALIPRATGAGKKHVIVPARFLKDLRVDLMIEIGVEIVHFHASLAVIKDGVAGNDVAKIGHASGQPQSEPRLPETPQQFSGEWVRVVDDGGLFVTKRNGAVGMTEGWKLRILQVGKETAHLPDVHARPHPCEHAQTVVLQARIESGIVVSSLGVDGGMRNVEIAEALHYADFFEHRILERPVPPAAAATAHPRFECPAWRRHRLAGDLRIGSQHILRLGGPDE